MRRCDVMRVGGQNCLVWGLVLGERHTTWALRKGSEGQLRTQAFLLSLLLVLLLAGA